ncbi:MAG: two-component system sensor histidine kinase NtrB [Fidelibacterota bacterium]
MKPALKIETELRSTVSARTIMILGIVLLVLYSSFAGFEYYQSKKDLLEMMKEGGFLLLDALMVSSERAIIEYEKKAFSRENANGPGQLIKTIMQQNDIVYIALQDDYGTLMGSENLPDIDPVLMDPFLLEISIAKKKDARIYEIGAMPVFEIAGSFFFRGQYIGVYRIGLPMDEYRRILTNIRLRFIITALIFLFIGLIGFSVMVANQNTRILAESYQRVKTYTGKILENLKDAVVAADQNGTVTVFNAAAAELFEIPPEKVIGKSLAEIRLPCLAPILDTLETGKTRRVHHFLLNLRGRRKILNLATSMVRNQPGDIETVIMIATDMTARRQLEEQLQRQEKLTAMGELASGVAHEIRNPINAIGIIAQRLQKEFRPCDNEEEQKEFDELTVSIITETKRINQTIQQFLHFAKPAALQRQPTDIRDFLHEIGRLFKSSSTVQNIAFSIQVKNNARLLIDPQQMKQALLNLLRNALDATPSNGQIRLSAHKTDNHYEITVSDTGSGIPDEILKKIFNIYFTTKRNGTGMGLPIVSQIVQQHDGKIIVESNPAKGTTFRILLPFEERS